MALSLAHLGNKNASPWPRKFALSWSLISAFADLCAERPYCAGDLKEVVNRRFEFYGFPLRLEPAYGSPVRAVAILDD